MSLLDRLRGRKSPTGEWREDRSVRLVIDLDRFELCGVGLGEPIERLSFLGPSESLDFDYHRKGLRVDVTDGRLDGLTIALEPGAFLGTGSDEAVRAFAGGIRIAAVERSGSQRWRERDFTEAWGQPYWRDEDEDEVLLFFEFPGREVQVELSPEGRARVLVLTPDPLLADPEQRASYRVDRAWPPTYEQEP